MKVSRRDDLAGLYGLHRASHLYPVHDHGTAGSDGLHGEFVFRGDIRRESHVVSRVGDSGASRKVFERYKDIVFWMELKDPPLAHAIAPVWNGLGAVFYCSPPVQRSMRAPAPFISRSTSGNVTMVVSPGVVIARAPCAAPHSTAHFASLPVRNP